MKEPVIKTCPACGKTFACQGEEDCWCESVKLHRKQMMEIMELYHDCLCPECLKGYEAE